MDSNQELSLRKLRRFGSPALIGKLDQNASEFGEAGLVDRKRATSNPDDPFAQRRARQAFVIGLGADDPGGDPVYLGLGDLRRRRGRLSLPSIASGRTQEKDEETCGRGMPDALTRQVRRRLALKWTHAAMTVRMHDFTRAAKIQTRGRRAKLQGYPERGRAARPRAFRRRNASSFGVASRLRRRAPMRRRARGWN